MTDKTPQNTKAYQLSGDASQATKRSDPTQQQ